MAAVLVCATACGPAESPQPTKDRPHDGSAAAAVPEARAAGVAARILEEGGNAADAAVAVQFALAVTYPIAGNIGGGGFALLHVPGEGELALDFRETAPLSADPALFQDEEGTVIEGLSLHSHLAAGVPGTVDGMWELHRRYGSKPWEDLLEPAIELASEGFELDEWTAKSFAEARDRFEDLDQRYRRHVDFSRFFGGSSGETFRQPELAETLRRIAARGPTAFYDGETAELIVDEMQSGNGAITRRDLASYEPVWRDPVEGGFRGRRVVSMPPPSSGGIALMQLLGMLETFEVPEFHSAEHLHLVAEIEKRVFADRSHYLGDPDFYPVPLQRLITDDYLRRRAAGISLGERTSPDTIEPGSLPEESPDTTHYSIIGSGGMTIAVTTTLNAAYGSGIVVDGAGFLLNNEMDDFSAKPGVPNLYGVTGGTANQVEPGKRMLSSMSPTLVFDENGELSMALGSPGGPTIFTTVFQVIVNHVDHGMPLEEAIAAARFHHQWPPRSETGDRIRIETIDTWPREVITRLEELGYDVSGVDRLGDVQAIGIEGGRAVAHSDPRLNGRAVRVEAEEVHR
jgi:gamma-glutamyltranspeptidase/glutathione hydrolase